MMFKLLTAQTIKTFNFGDSPELSAATVALFTGAGMLEGNDFAAFLCCTPVFREALGEFIAKWRQQCKYVNRLNDFFKSVADDEHFAFVSHQPELPFGDFQSKNLNIQSYRLRLICLARGIEYKPRLHTRFLATEGLAITRYGTLYFGYEDEEVRIGEPDKRKRVCRYCGRSMPEVKFKNVAHAIPDALGNKSLFCNEECDTCNARLSKVEDSFTSHMEQNRVVCSVPNKDGKIPEIEGRDFVVRRDADGNPRIIVNGSKADLHQNPDGTMSLRINGSKPIYDNDIYKTLVKCVIGLLPAEELPHFVNTISWINGKLFDTVYPSVYKAYINGVNVQPICKIFLNHKRVPYSPYCTALLYTCDMVYMFMLPFVTLDEGRFKYDSDLVRHWQDFKNYFPKKWSSWDLSSTEPKTSFYYHTIDPANVQPLSPGSVDPSVFVSKRPRSKKQREEVVFPEPDPGNVSRVTISDPQISFTPGLNLTEAMKRDVSVQCAPVIYIDPSRSCCTVVVDICCMDTTGSVEYMRCSYRCNVFFKDFSRNIEAGEGTLAFDYRLREMLWTVTCVVGERFFVPKRAGTQFASFRLDSLANYKQLVENITYILPDGTCIDSSNLVGRSFLD